MQNETINPPNTHLETNTFQTPLFIVVLSFLFFPLISLIESFSFEKGSLKRNLKTLSGALILSASYITNIFLQIFYTAHISSFFVINLVIGLLCMDFHSNNKELHKVEGKGFSKTQLWSLGVFLSIVSVLPNIDLFGIRDMLIEPRTGLLELWQTCLLSILFVCLSLYLYQITRPKGVDIKMFLLLYCFTALFASQVLGYWEALLNILNLSGSWLNHFVIYLVGAVLALDYKNCKSTMGIIKTWFQKTLLKMINILVVLLMYEGAFAPISYFIHKEMYEQNLIQDMALTRASLLDIDNSNHAINYRIKTNLINKRLLFHKSPQDSSYIQWLLEQNDDLQFKSSILNDLKNYMKESSKFPVLDVDQDLFFRPVDSEWDVLIAVARKQGLITDHNQVVSKFKTNNSEKNYGALPSMKLLHTVSFVQEVLGVESTMIEPKLSSVTTLLANNLYPIVQFDLSQVTYYGAIVDLDLENGFALLRMESGVLKEGLAKLYDAGLDKKHFQRIVSEQTLIVPIRDLEKTLNLCDLPMAVLESPKKVSNLLAISEKELSYTKRAAYFQEIHAIDNTRYEKLINLSNEQFTKSMVLAQWLYDYLHQYSLSNADISLASKRLPRDQEFSMILSYLKDVPLSKRSKIRLGGCLFEEFPKLGPKLTLLLDYLYVDGQDIGDYAMSTKLYNFATGLYLHGQYKKALPYFKIINARHPKSFKYEISYKLCQLQLGEPTSSFKSFIIKKHGKWLYFRFLKLFKSGDKDQARLLLDSVLKDDPHNKMAIQLLQKYYDKNETQFEFTSFKGL
ncbi:MAG: hypothetical protein KC646_12215 [Candidatus Cloacimonetes bacterium]|nr:hypothetical protein [Candidatus Cloacimonadota bacterium]